MKKADRTTFHTCPVRGCSRRVMDRRVMCAHHWLMLPLDLRDEVWVQYYAAPGSRSHANAIRAAVAWVDQSEQSHG